MFATLQREATRSGDCSVRPFGRDLKRTSALLQPLLRTKAINGGLRLAEARFRSRRDIEYLIRGSLETLKLVFLLAID